ncbi:hypothetical protein ABPG75_009665 [Micractinium tetrahymenae]
MEGGLAAVERLLLERDTGVSVLSGALVRVLTTRGSHLVRPVARTSLALQGSHLLLHVSGIGAPVPATNISSKHPFLGSQQWRSSGKAELAELSAWASKQAPVPQLTLGSVAAVTHRLEVALLWREHLAHLAGQQGDQLSQLTAQLCDSQAIQQKAAWLLQEAPSPQVPSPPAASAQLGPGCLPPGFVPPQDPRRRRPAQEAAAPAATPGEQHGAGLGAPQAAPGAGPGSLPGSPAAGNGSSSSSGESVYSLMGRLLAQRSPAQPPQQAQQAQQGPAPRWRTGQQAGSQAPPAAAGAGTPQSRCTPHPQLPPGFGSVGPASRSARRRQQQAQREQGSSAKRTPAPAGAAAAPAPAAVPAATKPASPEAEAAAAARAAYEEQERHAIRSLFEDEEEEKEAKGSGGSSSGQVTPVAAKQEGPTASGSSMDCSEGGQAVPAGGSAGKRGRKASSGDGGSRAGGPAKRQRGRI